NAHVPAERELTLEQLLHAAPVHHQHDVVGLFAAQLEADAAALNPDGRWPCPSLAVFRTATDHSFAVLAPEDKSGALQPWHDDHAFRFVQQLLGNCAFFDAHDLVKDGRRLVQALNLLRLLFVRGAEQASQGYCRNSDMQFHESSSFPPRRPSRSSRKRRTPQASGFSHRKRQGQKPRVAIQCYFYHKRPWPA